MKFRKKPVVIEAWQWLFTPDQEESPGWMNDAIAAQPYTVGSAAFWPDGNAARSDQWATAPHISIHTLEGEMFAQPGDWIIRGVKGELYPCKPDIFDATYEPVMEQCNASL